MPRSTPEVKQTEVRRHGGRHVKIMLHGDCYDETAAAAHEYTETHGCTFVHPYDDLVTMAGQGTLADEVVMSGEGPFDRAYVAIGRRRTGRLRGVLAEKILAPHQGHRRGRHRPGVHENFH